MEQKIKALEKEIEKLKKTNRTLRNRLKRLYSKQEDLIEELNDYDTEIEMLSQKQASRRIKENVCPLCKSDLKYFDMKNRVMILCSDKSCLYRKVIELSTKKGE